MSTLLVTPAAWFAFSRPAEVTFIAQLPPLGYSTFFMQPAAEPSAAGRQGRASHAVTPAAATVRPPVQHSKQPGSQDEAVLDNGLVRLEFDASTGAQAEPPGRVPRAGGRACCAAQSVEHGRACRCSSAVLQRRPGCAPHPASCCRAAGAHEGGRHLCPPRRLFCLVQLQRRPGLPGEQGAGQRRLHLQVRRPVGAVRGGAGQGGGGPRWGNSAPRSSEDAAAGGCSLS